MLRSFGIAGKILAVTADNASANDTMVDNMALDLPVFPGKEHFVRCFNHTVNLIGKSLLKLFEGPKNAADGSDTALDAAEEALRTMEKDIEIEDLRTQLNNYTNQGSIGADDPFDVFDEVGDMTPAEAEEFRESVLPIRRALVKVSWQLDLIAAEILTPCP
jgi:hypothetical protein